MYVTLYSFQFVPLDSAFSGYSLFALDTDYRGNFDMYVKLRDEKTKNAARVYEAYQSKRAHMMEFIDKFRGTWIAVCPQSRLFRRRTYTRYPSHHHS